MSNYYEWVEFKDVFLEDSFVVDIRESVAEVSFGVELVLCENHPMYRSPKIGEQYCYRKADIVFGNVCNVKWLERSNRSFIDANGTMDYGNIDVFKFLSEGYYLEGDWGRVVISSDFPIVKWAGD